MHLQRHLLNWILKRYQHVIAYFLPSGLAAALATAIVWMEPTGDSAVYNPPSINATDARLCFRAGQLLVFLVPDVLLPKVHSV